MPYEVLRGLHEKKAPNTLSATIPRWRMFSCFLTFSEIEMHLTIISFLDMIKGDDGDGDGDGDDDDDDDEKHP